MPLLEISVVPVGSNSASFSSNVSKAIELIKGRGLNYQLTPTATVIEGNIHQLMDLAKDIHQNEISNGTKRVITNISIDDRVDKPLSLTQQVDIVQQTTT